MGRGGGFVTGLGAVAENCLGDVLSLFSSEAELDRGVTVAVAGFDVDYNAGTGLNHRNGNDTALFVVNLSHAQFFTD